MTMDLARLIECLPNATSRGDLHVTVASIATDSRQLTEGSLFIAIPGYKVDGHSYIRESISRGAVAMLAQQDRWEAIEVSMGLESSFPVITVPDSRLACADIAAALYGCPARRLRTIGVTGTDGKTTTTLLISAILEAAGYRTGLLSTVLYKVGNKVYSNESHQTTPEAVEIQHVLAQILESGGYYAVLEATSHGLALHRLRACYFDVAVLTNVTGDHLDFHGSFEGYRLAKERLFRLLSEEGCPEKTNRKVAVVNADDPSSPYFVDAAGDSDVWTYAVVASGRVTSRHLQQVAWGTRFRLHTPLGEVPVHLSIPGRFNVSNALAAASTAISLGVPLETVKEGIEQFRGAPGRMELIQEVPFTVVVDYAHTPHAMSTVLETLRRRTGRRLTVVFGSMGGREAQRRAGLAHAVAHAADYAVVTTDDPGPEDPVEIIREIAAALEVEGRHEGKHYCILVNRHEAIRWAISRAEEGDVILLAGMGSESSMLVAGGTIPWDDREVARQCLAERAIS